MRATHNEIRKIIRKKNSNAVSPLIRDLNAIIARTVAVTYLSKGKRSKELISLHHRNNIDLIQLYTDEPYEKAFRIFFATRARRR